MSRLNDWAVETVKRGPVYATYPIMRKTSSECSDQHCGIRLLTKAERFRDYGYKVQNIDRGVMPWSRGPVRRLQGAP